MLAAHVADATLPSPDAQTVYVVYVPATTALTITVPAQIPRFASSGYVDIHSGPDLRRSVEVGVYVPNAVAANAARTH